MYNITFTKQALKDLRLLEQRGLIAKIETFLDIIENNPFQNPPPYEKMSGYENRYSRRINLQHRLVYEIYNNVIKIISMWTHYE
jgi:Txe/YoeB family toxin of toxin-antitoxin system